MNELVLKEDINKVAELNSNALNTVVAQMTSLANAIVSDRDDIDSMVESLEKQAWYKRMWNTLTGKNKAAKEEIAQKKDQMTGYIIQSLGSLYEMGKISQDMVVSLGQKINDIYYQVSLNSFETLAAKEAIVQLRGMVGKIATELNAKIESVDNFNILNKQIEQGVYGNEKAVSAICRILSNMDNRMLSDQRKVDIIGRSMETAGIINDADTAITDIMADIAEVTDDKIGEVYLELSSMSGNFWAGLFSQVMERYTMLPKMERMAKKKDVIIRNILEKNDIDESAAFSTHDLYGSFIESRQEMAEMVSKVRIEDSSSNNTEEADPTLISSAVKSASVGITENVSSFEVQIKENDKTIRGIFDRLADKDYCSLYEAFDMDCDEHTVSDDAAMLMAIIEAELVFYHYMDKIDEAKRDKLTKDPGMFIKDNYKIYSDKLGFALYGLLDDLVDEYNDDPDISNMENALIDDRGNTLKKIYEKGFYQFKLNSDIIEKTLDRILEKDELYYSYELSDILTEEYPEDGKKLANIIAAECRTGAMDGGFFFYHELIKLIYDYRDDNYYKMSTEDLYDSLVYDRFSLCYRYVESKKKPLAKAIQVRPDNYDYECSGDCFSRKSVIGDGQSLENVEIRYGVTRIGKHAFMGHNEIRNISIPNSIEEIDDEAFKEACGKAVIVIPNSVNTISRYAFNYCYAKKIYMCDYAGVTNVRFECCNFTKLVLSDSLKKVELAQCSLLNKLDLKNIFPFDAEVWHCHSLKSVIFRNDRSSSDFFSTYQFFKECPKLKYLYFPRGFKSSLVDQIVTTICENNEGKTPSDYEIIYFD